MARVETAMEQGPGTAIQDAWGELQRHWKEWQHVPCESLRVAIQTRIRAEAQRQPVQNLVRFEMSQHKLHQYVIVQQYRVPHAYNIRLVDDIGISGNAAADAILSSKAWST